MGFGNYHRKFKRYAADYIFRFRISGRAFNYFWKIFNTPKKDVGMTYDSLKTEDIYEKDSDHDFHEKIAMEHHMVNLRAFFSEKPILITGYYYHGNSAFPKKISGDLIMLFSQELITSEKNIMFLWRSFPASAPRP